MLPAQEGATSTPAKFDVCYWIFGVLSTVPFVRLLYGDSLQQLESIRGKSECHTKKGVRAKE